MKKIFTVLILSSLFLIVAARPTDKQEEKKTDTQAPEIKIVAPEDEEAIFVGDKHGMHLVLLLEDDVMLSSYQIKVEPDGELLEKVKNTKPFLFQKSWDISGNKKIKIHHHEVVIPQKATPGKYLFVVSCRDTEGNESEVTRKITLERFGDSSHIHEHH